jgi:hypothetical protein
LWRRPRPRLGCGAKERRRRRRHQIMGEIRNSYKILVENFERKSSLGRPKLRWEVNIRMDLREIRVGRFGEDAPGSEEGPVAGS